MSDGADGAGAPVCSPRRWQVSPWGLSAHYSVSDHVLVFPAGLLQPPFFHPGYPRYGPCRNEGREFPESDGQMLRWMGLVVGELGFKLLKDSGVRRALVSLGP